eukprot:gene17121-biopygen14379
MQAQPARWLGCTHFTNCGGGGRAWQRPPKSGGLQETHVSQELYNATFVPVAGRKTWWSVRVPRIPPLHPQSAKCSPPAGTPRWEALALARCVCKSGAS